MKCTGMVLAYDLAEGESLAQLVEKATYTKPTKEVPFASKTYPTSAGVQIQRDGTTKAFVTVHLSAVDDPLSALDDVLADFNAVGLV